MAKPEELRHIPWPTLPKEAVAVAHVLADAIKVRRGDQIESVFDEVELETVAGHLVDQAASGGGKLGISPAISSALKSDPTFRNRVKFATVVMASHLYPLSMFVYTPTVENITCYAYDHWMVAFGDGVRARVDGSPFKDEGECIEFFRKIIKLQGATGNLELTDATPVVEVNIGSIARVVVVKKPALSSESGIAASIRIPSKSLVQNLQDYVNGHVMSLGMAYFVEALVQGRANILIAGGTSSGKTTLLRVLCGLFGERENVVVIEDGAELHLDEDRGTGKPWHAETVSLSTVESVRQEGEVGKIDLFDLVRTSLRFQPDRIIMGESRGGEIGAICKALQAGHDGSLTTIHAESADLAIDRAVMYALESDQFQGNEHLAQKNVRAAFHVVIHLKSTPQGRKVSGIAAVTSGGNLTMIYRLTPEGGWVREIEFLSDLGELAPRLRPFLASEIPAV